ncbi:MAG: phosphotransferase family protein [Halanaeroarchaeum sp.]
MTGESSLDAEVSNSTVRRMVHAIEHSWVVESIERSPFGTDLVATLGVHTPDGDRRVVLKATTADLVDPRIARSEPRLLRLVDDETSIPVPTVFGYRDDHDEYPAPFYLMEYVEGENVEASPDELSPSARESVLRQAGRHLAELHELGPLPAVGRIGVEDGDLAVLDTDEYPRYDDFRDRVLTTQLETVETLTEGGHFLDYADEPERFADLVPGLREHLRETIPNLPDPDPATYCHWDYRYGNLLVEPKTGDVRAVLDWANLTAADPAYNLAKAEAHLLTPAADDEERTENLREIFRTAYADTREDWSFDDATRERIRVYRLTCQVDAMACLPLWYEDATPEEKDRREAEHREFVARYLE